MRLAKRELVPVLILPALTLLCYSTSFHGQFVFDDQQVVLQNSQLMNIRTAGDVMSLGAGWRQLLFITYGLNYYWGGLDTFGYHALNVALHAVNVLLVYGIILAAVKDFGLRISDSGLGGEADHGRFAAVAGAAVFSVHTLFTSAVSYISGRSSILCATFYFAAVLLFFKTLAAPRGRTRFLYSLFTGAAGFLAWQAKQEAITLPLLLAAILLLRSEKKDWRWIALLAAVPAALVVLARDELASVVAVVYANKVLVSAGFEQVLSPAIYFPTYLTAVVSYYFPRLIFPVNLSADPQITPIQHWYSPELLFSILVLSALPWLAMRSYRRKPLFSVGIVALLVSPIAAYAVIPLADVVLEHRAYIPGLGIAFLFGWVFHWIARNYFSMRWLSLCALVGLFGVMTAARNTVWTNNIVLWEDAEAKAPGKPRTHFNLGQAYQQAGRWPEAIHEYDHALRLKPDIHAAYANIAAIYLDQNRFDRAEEMLLKVTSLAPDFTEGFINLGVLYIRRQEPDRALPPLNRALAINPEAFAAHFNKAEALTQKGDFRAALESYKEAVHIRPDLDSFRLALGAAYSRMGDRASAAKEFLAVNNGPLAAEGVRNLGILYRDAGEADKAMEFFNQAAGMRTVFPEVHHDIGILYLQKQMTAEAIEQFRITLQQQPDYGPAFLNLAAAYQVRGEPQMARQILEAYVQQYGNTYSPYIARARQALERLK
jgi:tetratricopeptide (TPR) repeat protein